MCRLSESTLVFRIHVYIIKEQQTEVINIKCYHDNLYSCKGINHEYPKSSFFLHYLQERHLLSSSRNQSMYLRQKDAHFQLH